MGPVLSRKFNVGRITPVNRLSGYSPKNIVANKQVQYGSNMLLAKDYVEIPSRPGAFPSCMFSKQLTHRLHWHLCPVHGDCRTATCGMYMCHPIGVFLSESAEVWPRDS